MPGLGFGRLDQSAGHVRGWVGEVDSNSLRRSAFDLVVLSIWSGPFGGLVVWYGRLTCLGGIEARKVSASMVSVMWEAVQRGGYSVSLASGNDY